MMWKRETAPRVPVRQPHRGTVRRNAGPPLLRNAGGVIQLAIDTECRPHKALDVQRAPV